MWMLILEVILIEVTKVPAVFFRTLTIRTSWKSYYFLQCVAVFVYVYGCVTVWHMLGSICISTSTHKINFLIQGVCFPCLCEHLWLVRFTVDTIFSCAWYSSWFSLVCGCCLSLVAPGNSFPLQTLVGPIVFQFESNLTFPPTLCTLPLESLVFEAKKWLRTGLVMSRRKVCAST